MGDNYMIEKEIKPELSTESFHKTLDKDVEKYKLENGYKTFNQDNILGDISELESMCLDRLKNPSHNEYDLRVTKMSEFSTGLNKSILQHIATNHEISVIVSDEINKFVDNILSKTKYILSNKSSVGNSSKLLIDIFPKSKYISLGKIVPLDIDEDYLFKSIGLKS
jgi:hypothetical protein